MNPAERVVLAIEAQIQAGARAREVFGLVKDLPKPEGHQYEVLVVVSVEERSAPGSYSITGGLSFTTESDSSPSQALRRTAESFANDSTRQGESVFQFSHQITTDATGGTVPRAGMY